MTDQSSLEVIENLLLKFPGVTSAVVFRDPGANPVQVRFRCIDVVSLKAIAYCAVAANVSIELGYPGSRICAEREQSLDLPCDIEIPDEETELPTQPQRLGVWLAEWLTRKGLLSGEEYAHLQTRWNMPLIDLQRDY